MFRCENCKVKKDIGDDVYFVESSFSGFLATCSIECAEFIKNREIKELKKNVGN